MGCLLENTDQDAHELPVLANLFVDLLEVLVLLSNDDLELLLVEGLD